MVLVELSSFNPRARVGRDDTTRELMDEIKVSIHAPAWGATRLAMRSYAEMVVSIHAPAWGATY